jgi:hypothetical protein
MPAVTEAVYELTDAGVTVLSPADPRPVHSLGDFLLVASDLVTPADRLTVRGVQSRHLSSIAASDFLWLVAPDGYVGPSAALELGFALASGVPVFGTTAPDDLTMRQFVTVADMGAVVALATRLRVVSAALAKRR